MHLPNSYNKYSAPGQVCPTDARCFPKMGDKYPLKYKKIRVVCFALTHLVMISSQTGAEKGLMGRTCHGASLPVLGIPSIWESNLMTLKESAAADVSPWPVGYCFTTLPFASLRIF